jgi:hypothetical protein
MPTSRPLLNLQSHNLQQQDIFGPEGNHLSGRFTFSTRCDGILPDFSSRGLVPLFLGIIHTSTINS